jgi:hypothetical protein
MGRFASAWDRLAWVLLLLIAVLLVALPLLDIAGVAQSGIPSDHASTYRALTGEGFTRASAAASYVSQLEYAYALHELTFALFLFVIVVIPLRAGQRWAWWTCWITLIATVGYTLTFARYGQTTLAYSLVPAVGIPVLLLLQAPRFLSRRSPVSTVSGTAPTEGLRGLDPVS